MNEWRIKRENFPSERKKSERILERLGENFEMGIRASSSGSESSVYKIRPCPPLTMAQWKEESFSACLHFGESLLMLLI